MSLYRFLEVDGETRTPPFPPSARFLLGTDQQGRDLLSLLISGAGQTLSIAAAVMAARMIVGFVLGAVSGWYHRRAVDQAITSLAGAEAAFPSLILGVLLILALGIQKGLPTFVLALCFLGWAEVTQYVRGEFVTIRQRPFIEGARAVGLSTPEIITRHVLPNVFPSLLALASLEMGSVLLTLGELGFVGIFIGGGISTMDVYDRPVVYFSVPEWGAMLSNSWRYARSYPWMTLYPAAAFFVAVLGFNLLGMGLQELVERAGVNLASLPFKRLLMAAAVAAVVVWLILDNTGPAVIYARQARAFDVERALVDVRHLTREELEGRRAGSEGARRAAEYIAEQFAAAGLEPAGDNEMYFQEFEFERLGFAEIPQLVLKDQEGNVLEEFAYLEDFVVDVSAGPPPFPVVGRLTVMGQHQPKSALSFEAGPLLAGEPGEAEVVLGLDFYSTMGRDPRPEPPLRVGALAVVKHIPYHFERWSVPRSGFSFMGADPFARFKISDETADRLLRHLGLHLKELREEVQRLPGGQGKVWETTGRVRMSYLLQRQPEAKGINVLGTIPGKSKAGQVVVIGAHYDGLGRDLQGRLYPGAVDNASGVAALLEIARIWKEQGYQPERTVIFAAWGNVEQGGLDSGIQCLLYSGLLPTYSLYGVIHLDSIAYGPDAALGLQEWGSYGVLPQLRKAARKLGVGTMLRSHSPHQYSFSESYSDRPMPIIVLCASDVLETTHCPSDTIEAIVPEHLAGAGMVADVAARLMSGLSSEKREVRPQVHVEPTLSLKPTSLQASPASTQVPGVQQSPTLAPTELSTGWPGVQIEERSWTADELLARRATEQSPVWADGDELTFFYQGEADEVYICCGIQLPMQPIEGTDLWALTVRIRDLSQAVIGYTFIPHQEGSPVAVEDPMDSMQQWRGPEAPPAPERTESLHGQIREHVIDSKVLDEPRRVTVYLPPDHDPTQHIPVVYAADGHLVRRLATILDPLIVDGSVPAVIVVGVHSGAEQNDSLPRDPAHNWRAREYLLGYDRERFERHEHFFVDEVAGWAEQNLGAATVRGHRAVFGFSNGGAFAIAMGVRHPERYANVLAFSLARGPAGLGTPEWTADMAPRHYLLAGTLEPFRETTADWAAKLARLGVEHIYRERVCGHDITVWEEEFPGAVVWAFATR